MSNNNDLLNFQNYFYGSHDHYDHPGFYFDVIIDNFEDAEHQCQLNNLTDVRPGRYVLVKDVNSIFMRAGENESYYYIKPNATVSTDEDSEIFYYDNDDINGKLVEPGDDAPQAPLTTTTGYRFIAYTNKMNQVLLTNGVLLIPNNGQYIYTTTDQIGGLASYYFGTVEES